ncbi:unnamed protein product [Closterium sp. Naga37s-1]|nr:unnamed protein product [Closterium sp. Naga37s-1]
MRQGAARIPQREQRSQRPYMLSTWQSSTSLRKFPGLPLYHHLLLIPQHTFPPSPFSSHFPLLGSPLTSLCLVLLSLPFAWFSSHFPLLGSPPPPPAVFSPLSPCTLSPLVPPLPSALLFIPGGQQCWQSFNAHPGNPIRFTNAPMGTNGNVKNGGRGGGHGEMLGACMQSGVGWGGVGSVASEETPRSPLQLPPSLALPLRSHIPSLLTHPLLLRPTYSPSLHCHSLHQHQHNLLHRSHSIPSHLPCLPLLRPHHPSSTVHAFHVPLRLLPPSFYLNATPPPPTAATLGTAPSCWVGRRGGHRGMRTIYSSAASILPPTASILPPAASILPPAASILPPAASILPPAASILPPATLILLPAALPAVADDRRAVADDLRADADGQRAVASDLRADAAGQRATADDPRADADGQRVTADDPRADADGQRATARAAR